MSDDDAYKREENESFDEYLERVTGQMADEVANADKPKNPYEAVQELHQGLTEQGKFSRTESLYIIGVYLATAAVMQSYATLTGEDDDDDEEGPQ